MVKLTDVLEIVRHTIGSKSEDSRFNFKSTINLCVLLKGMHKHSIGVVSPYDVYSNVVDPVVEFWAYIPLERKRQVFIIGDNTLSLDKDFAYYIHVLITDLGYKNAFQIHHVKINNFVRQNQKCKLLIDPYSTVKATSPTQLAVQVSAPLIRYENMEYDHITEGRWLDLASRKLTTPTNNTTDGILLDMRATRLVALDIDNSSVSSFTTLIDYVCSIDSWSKCYIYRSSESGLHAYLSLAIAYNAISLFIDPSPMCSGFKTWTLNSGFQVIRRGPKFNKPNSDIVQLAQLDRNGNDIAICTNIQSYNDPYVSTTSINLRN